LRAENYSLEVAGKINAIKTVESFAKNFDSIASKSEKLINFVRKLPAPIQNLAWLVQRYWQKKVHFGQVIPLKDVERILEKMNSIVRLPCLCRRYFTGQKARTCFGITINPLTEELAKKTSKIMLNNPDLASLEYMTLAEAMDVFDRYDREGLIHTVWTIRTPYVIAICNCSLDSCIWGLDFSSRDVRRFSGRNT